MNISSISPQSPLRLPQGGEASVDQQPARLVHYLRGPHSPLRLFMAATLLATLSLASCSEDDEAPQGTSIGISVVNPDQMETRAQVSTIGDVSPGFWLQVTNDKGSYIDEFALYDWRSGKVTLSDDFLWPDGEQTFVGCCDGQSMMLSSPLDSQGGIHIDSHNGDQDYVVAYAKVSKEETTNGTVNLQFHHVLAYANIYYMAAEHAADDPNVYTTTITDCTLYGVYPLAIFNPVSLVDNSVKAWTSDTDNPMGESYHSHSYSFINQQEVTVYPTSEPQYLKDGSQTPYELCVIPGEYTLKVTYRINSSNPNAKAETRAMTGTETYSKTAKVTLVGGAINSLIIDLSGKEISGGNDNDDPSAPDNPEAD